MRKTLPKFYDRDADKVQCQECGVWLKMLGVHIHRKHPLVDYVKKYNLIAGDLICQSTRIKQSMAGKKNVKRSLENIKKYIEPIRKDIYLIPKKKSLRTAETRTTIINNEKRKKMTNGMKFFWSSENLSFQLRKELSDKFRKGKNIRCIICGKEVYKKLYEIKKNQNCFCSNKCRGKFQHNSPEFAKKISEGHSKYKNQ